MPFYSRYLQHKSVPLVGMLTALSALALITAISLDSIDQFNRRSRWVTHTHSVISQIGNIGSLLKDGQSAVRGFVIARQDSFLQPYDSAVQYLPPALTTLHAMLVDNLDQQHEADRLEEQVKIAMAINAEHIRLVRTNRDSAAALALIASGAGDAVMAHSRELMQRMVDSQHQLLLEREAEADAVTIKTRLLIVLGALVGALFGTVAFRLLRVEISKRRAADNALTSANVTLQLRAAELEVTNGALESFSYSISHDLRIPLRAISGYTRMLEEDYLEVLDTEGRRLLGVIRDNGKRMGDLIDDLLAFSRLGRQVMHVEPIDMQHLVQSVVEQLQPQQSDAAARFDVAALAHAVGDRALLQQVWINLISNALKYSANVVQPIIQITSTESAAEIIYTVTDNGVGFDMHYYAKLFGVFQRLHSADTFSGTGVGLAIAHRIIDRHGGRIWATAEVDHGASFSFAIPKQEVQHG